jgi:hypothetical protein
MDWYKAIIESTKRGDVRFGNVVLPGYPINELKVNTVGASGKDTVVEAFAFYEDCALLFSKSALWKRKRKRLLDFGCAWSRILRCFLLDFCPDCPAGIDVNLEFIEISKQTFPGPTFLCCDTKKEGNRLSFVPC